MTNLLQKYSRPPVIFTRIPSMGRWCKDKIDFTMNSELPVRAMSARDEILTKNPDALLNGEAVENMLRSCVPEVHNPRELAINDVDTLLIAIQFATYGDKMTYKAKCPKCSTEHESSLSRRTILGAMTNVPEINIVSVDEKDGNQLDIILKPYTYENSTLASLTTMQNAKRLEYIRVLAESGTMDDLTDENKRKRADSIDAITKKEVKELFVSSANLRLDLLKESVVQINIVDKSKAEGDPGRITVVTDKESISEYVTNIDSKTFGLIEAKMNEVMAFGVTKKDHIACGNEACKHEWDADIAYDTSSFFVPASSV